MASMWRRLMLYLGLGPDDEYEEFEEHPTDVAPAQGGQRYPSGDVSPSGSVRTMTRETTAAPADSVRPRSSQSAVKVVDPAPPTETQIMIVGSYGQALEAADRFKDGQPVIITLQSADPLRSSVASSISRPASATGSAARWRRSSRTSTC